MPAHPEDRPILKPEDTERYAFEPRHSPLPVPNLGIFDEPTACLKINQTWASHVLGYIAGLLRFDAWENGGEFVDHDSARYFAHNEVQKLIEAMTLGVCEVDCDQIEACLPSSPTIVNIENNITNVQNNVTTIQGDITTIEQNITIIKEQTNDNIYPALPTPAQGDALCGSAYRIADELIQVVQDTFLDLQTISVTDILYNMLIGGGWNGSLLKEFLDFAWAWLNSTIPADVASQRDVLAQIIYTNELDKQTTYDDMATAGFSTGVRDALQGAINAVTDGKWYLWAFVGSQTPNLICGGEWCYRDSSFAQVNTWWNSDGTSGNSSGWGFVTGRRLDNINVNSKGAQVEAGYSFAQAVNIEEIELSISVNRPSPDDVFLAYRAGTSGAWTFVSINGGTGTYTRTFTGLNLNTTVIQVGVASGYSGATTNVVATATLNYARFKGNLPNPFGSSNCS